MQITWPTAPTSYPSDCSDPPIGCVVAQEFLTVHRLSKHFRAALREHFAHLSADDLFLRFGAHCRPEIIDAYVDGIDYRESIVLGVFNDNLQLIGVAHLGSDEGGLELGLSVLAEYREHGVGTLLLRRAMQHARAAGADRRKSAGYLPPKETDALAAGCTMAARSRFMNSAVYVW